MGEFLKLVPSHRFRLISLAAKSFYNLEMQYSLVITEFTPEPDLPDTDIYFEINPTTGDLVANKLLDFTVDPHRFVVDVTATETISGFSTTQQAQILTLWCLSWMIESSNILALKDALNSLSIVSSDGAAAR